MSQTVYIKFVQSSGCKIGKTSPENAEIVKNAFLKIIRGSYEATKGPYQVFMIKGLSKPRPVVTFYDNGKIKLDNINLDELKIKV